MSAHPTGPWKRVGHRQIADANGNVIAEIWSGGCVSLEAADAAEDLIAAAPELLEALRDCVDAQWHMDSHTVRLDSTIIFGFGYDFSGLEGWQREEFLAEYSCLVWPSGGKWSAYCTYEGSTWFEQFATADEAKERCMKFLDKVLPDHPAMKARAAIARATGAAS